MSQCVSNSSSSSKTGQGIIKAEIIIILAEQCANNFADHFSELVSNKLVFPDSAFLRARAFSAY